MHTSGGREHTHYFIIQNLEDNLTCVLKLVYNWRNTNRFFFFFFLTHVEQMVYDESNCGLAQEMHNTKGAISPCTDKHHLLHLFSSLSKYDIPLSYEAQNTSIMKPCFVRHWTQDFCSVIAVSCSQNMLCRCVLLCPCRFLDCQCICIYFIHRHRCILFEIGGI